MDERALRPQTVSPIHSSKAGGSSVVLSISPANGRARGQSSKARSHSEAAKDAAAGNDGRKRIYASRVHSCKGGRTRTAAPEARFGHPGVALWNGRSSQ